MHPKLRQLIDIITNAYENTEHCEKNSFFYHIDMQYNENKLHAGIDANMEKYIKDNTPKDIYEQYHWFRSDSGRTYVSVL